MHPIVHPRLFTRITALCLCYLVTMMDTNMINSASMNIKMVSEVLTRHGITFDMPTWESFSSRTLPFHLSLLINGRELSESKVCWILFAFNIDSFSSLKSFEIFLIVRSHKLPIIFNFACVHIDSISWNFIGVTAIFEHLNDVYLFLDVISRSWKFIEMYV